MFLDKAYLSKYNKTIIFYIVLYIKLKEQNIKGLIYVYTIDFTPPSITSKRANNQTSNKIYKPSL